jgi:hypothetical protein
MNTLALLAIAGGFAGLAEWVVIVAAIAAIVFLACKVMQVAIPGWVIQLFWILVAAVICIFAIRFVAGL